MSLALGAVRLVGATVLLARARSYPGHEVPGARSRID